MLHKTTQKFCFFFFNKKFRDLLGGPVAETLRSQCRRPGFDL